MQEVEVTYTLGDLFAVTLHSWRNFVPRILILFGVLIAVFIAIPVVMDGASFRESVEWFPFDFYAGLIAFLFLFIVGVCPLIVYLRSKRQGTLGPNFLAFLEEGVRIKGVKGQSVIYWKALRRVEATKKRLFLFVAPSVSLVLPRRVFSDTENFEAAIEEARARRAAAKK